MKSRLSRVATFLSKLNLHSNSASATISNGKTSNGKTQTNRPGGNQSGNKAGTITASKLSPRAYTYPQPSSFYCALSRTTTTTQLVLLLLVLLPIMASTTTGCGYNRIQALDEQVSSSWADVLNQYKRRADLIPNLVNTVKGYAAHERETLEAVVSARAKATAFNLPAESLSDPQKLQEFQAVQSELGSALSRLLVISENYPSLKADQSFRDLQAQLEGTENRITVARTRFIEAVKEYNTTIRSFPVNLTAKAFGYPSKETFTVADVKKIEEPPAVDF